MISKAPSEYVKTIPQHIRAAKQLEGIREIKKGEKIALLEIYILDDIVKSIDVVANENIKKPNIISRIFKKINFLVWGDA